MSTMFLPCEDSTAAASSAASSGARVKREADSPWADFKLTMTVHGAWHGCMHPCRSKLCVRVQVTSFGVLKTRRFEAPKCQHGHGMLMVIMVILVIMVIMVTT